MYLNMHLRQTLGWCELYVSYRSERAQLNSVYACNFASPLHFACRSLLLSSYILLYLTCFSRVRMAFCFVHISNFDSKLIFLPICNLSCLENWHWYSILTSKKYEQCTTKQVISVSLCSYKVICFWYVWKIKVTVNVYVNSRVTFTTHYLPWSKVLDGTSTQTIGLIYLKS